MTGQVRVPDRAPRRGVTAAVALLVTSLTLAGGAVSQRQVVAERLGATGTGWHRGTPPGAAEPVLPGLPEQAPAPSTEGLRGVLEPLLADPALGTRTAVSVVDIGTGRTLFERGADTSSVPASTTKLLTAVAALAARGPRYRLTTRAVAGTSSGEVVLVGGGDPTLTAHADGTYPGAGRLDELAGQVRAALGGTSPTRVVVDTSLFAGPVFGPGWDADIPTGGYGAAITALMIDGARTSPGSAHGPAARSGQPDLAAGQAFASALGLPAGSVTRGTAAAEAKVLGEVRSPVMTSLVEYMLGESDNVIAECLARQVALARGQPASFAGGAVAMRAVLSELGLPLDGLTLADGSGLSRADRITPAMLTAALATAAKPDRTNLAAVFSGLPVGGYSGTLRDRYRKPVAGAGAAGLVRAKTGTLSGVSSIAGLAIDADGRALAFAILADGVPADVFAAQDALDRVAAALVSCGCR